jgi:hypothetical protein
LPPHFLYYFGASDGPSVGISVSSSVGPFVSKSDIASVGPFVGKSVGASVGLSFGASVGTSVGILDGVSVVELVRSFVDALVGASGESGFNVVGRFWGFLEKLYPQV